VAGLGKCAGQTGVSKSFFPQDSVLGLEIAHKICLPIQVCTSFGAFSWNSVKTNAFRQKKSRKICFHCISCGAIMRGL